MTCSGFLLWSYKCKSRLSVVEQAKGEGIRFEWSNLRTGDVIYDCQAAVGPNWSADSETDDLMIRSGLRWKWKIILDIIKYIC